MVFGVKPTSATLLFPTHKLFTLRGASRARLSPFDWEGEAVICLPQERSCAFRHIIRSE